MDFEVLGTHYLFHDKILALIKYCVPRTLVIKATLSLDETSIGLEGFGHQLCAEWEKETEKAKQYSVRVCLLRTGLVVGKNGSFIQPMILPFKLGLGGRLGNGKQWMPWVHIDDHVAICLKLLKTLSLKEPLT